MSETKLLYLQKKELIDDYMKYTVFMIDELAPLQDKEILKELELILKKIKKILKRLNRLALS